MQRGGTVYIMTNNTNKVLYTGVTSDLLQRVYQHRTHAMPESFTDKYNCTKLVWYKTFDRIEDAISEEKRIKAGSRQKKNNLIIESNPEWKDLWDEIAVSPVIATPSPVIASCLPMTREGQ